jgi:HlyD family secretion protein
MALSRKKKIIIGSSVGALILISVIASIFATRTDTPEVTVVKIEVRPELKSTVTSSGEVRPIQFMNLTSEVQGKIEEITKKEGDVVNKGEVLVRLDPNQLESNADAQFAAFQSAQTQITGAENQRTQANQQLTVAQIAVDTARQNASTAQTEIDRAQVELNAANRELKRTEQLLEKRVVSRLEFDNAQDRVENAKASLKTVRERLETQKIAIPRCSGAGPATGSRGSRRRQCDRPRVESRRSAGCNAARTTRSSRQDHRHRTDQRRHRRDSFEGRNLRCRRTVHDGATHYRRHVRDQRRG